MNTDYLVAHGHCPACGHDTTFRSKEHWLRDFFLCESCGSIPRERALMRVIEMYYPNWRDLRIHESSPGNRGTSVTLRRECKNYTASQYDTKIAFGKKHRSGSYQSEDLENQTFEDEAFDLVISQDVMEHVFDPKAAFREVTRTLRPGGAHIFTTPLVNKAKPTEQCAILHDNGTIEHLFKPEYHGNPIDSSGSLVTFRWGYDIVQWVFEACKLPTTMICIDDLSMGIRAEYIEVCLTQKPFVQQAILDPNRIVDSQGDVQPGIAPRGMDFDLPRPNVMPGNLREGNEHWADPQARQPIGELSSFIEDHPHCAELLENFDADVYLRANPDLVKAGVDEGSALKHFRNHGYRQRRLYSKILKSTFDHKFYRQQYPELKLKSKFDALTHYSYFGRYEDRIPNKLTAELVNAKTHLYQMGKVGSIAIRDAIQRAGGGDSPHLHWTDEYHGQYPTLGIHYSRILNRKREEPISLVVGVRDPFERIVSGFFQESQTLGNKESYADQEAAMDRLSSRFVRDAWVVCNWFQHQFYCGLDIHDHPFDHEAGYIEVEHENIRLFLYRMDALGDLEAPLAHFLKLPGMQMAKKNMGNQKEYASVYKEVAQQFRVPDQVANSLAESVYTKHFFTDQEREQMVNLWSAGQPTS